MWVIARHFHQLPVICFYFILTGLYLSLFLYRRKNHDATAFHEKVN